MPELENLNIFDFFFSFYREVKQKIVRLKEWYRCGESKLNPQAGVFLLGYEAFRVLVNYHDSKKGVGKYSVEDRDKIRESVHKYLLNPGADLVVCDEGHIIKNQKSTTSLAVNRICTKRRIVLTGTPIQNNLKECKSTKASFSSAFRWNSTQNVLFFPNRLRYG